MTTVAVLGATGRQGGSVVDALLAESVRDTSLCIRALTRRPDSPAAVRLADRGVEIRHADLNDEASLIAAFSEADIVFSVQDYWADGTGFDGEIRQARNVIAAARSAGVSHLIQSTMATAENVTGVAHFESKRQVEELVRQSGLPHTFVGTVFFLENALDPKMGGGMLFPTLAGTLAAETRMHLMSCADIGPVVSSIVSCPADYNGRRIDIAGDFLTVGEMKAIYRRTTGRRPKWYRLPRFVLRLAAGEFADQLEWHNRVNFSFSLDASRDSRVQSTSFEDFLRAHPGVRL